jgi:enoyl-CoA hydratase
LNRGSADIVFERRGTAGIVTLNRPQALNAVTLGMVHALAARLDEWAADPEVSRVLVTAAGERVFSAGGDIRALYDLARAGREIDALRFWRDEYRLNGRIKNYPKPYVALIDGIVMGGGVGVSVHGSHLVAGDKFLFAMPEVGIGFFPDVGATFVLPRMPGEIGTLCALTGERLKTADAVATGIATHYVPSARFAQLRDALCGLAAVDEVLAAYAVDPGEAPVLARRTAIDRLVAGDRVEDMLARLDLEGQGAAEAEWARAMAARIREKSPLSLKIALAQMRRGAAWPFPVCMQAEFRIVSRIVYGKDFYEGIRAVIIDKDNRPRWQPATLAEVEAAEVERHFAPIDDELALP